MYELKFEHAAYDSIEIDKAMLTMTDLKKCTS